MHTVYKTTNLITGKYYIGVHTCSTKCASSCTYLGSGKALKKAIKKHGRQNFTKEILSKHNTREKAFQEERRLVNPKDRNSYNLTEGGAAHLHLENQNQHLRKKVTFEGKSYPSIKALAEEYATTPEHASKWVRGLSTRNSHGAKTVTVKGINYPSITAAAKGQDVHHQTIKRWLKGGKKKCKPREISVNGTVYENANAASKEIGMSASKIYYRCKSENFRNYYFYS